MENFNENVVYLDSTDFDANGQLVHSHDKPVIVMIMATWCGFCKLMKPTLQQFADQHNGKTAYVAVIKTDGDEKEKELGARISKIVPGFRGYPTIVKFVNRSYVQTFTGPRTVEGLAEFVTKN